MADLNIALLITAQNQASGQLQRVNQDVTRLGGGITKAIGPAAMGAVAAGVALAARAVAEFANESLNEFQDFEAGMAEVFSILPGITDEAMGEMQNAVIGFAAEVGRTSDEVVPALYQALSSGIPQENVFEFMKIASDAARGGVTDLETAVDGITSAVNAYGVEALSAQEASDLMFTATVGGKTTFEELSQSMYNVIPTAASLGLEFGNVTAALAAMTAQGTPTSVATTQLRQLLVELSKDGGEAAETFERMAGQSFVDFIAAGGNLQEALVLMEQAAADSNVRLSDLFGSVEAGNAALSLTGTGAQKFSAELDAAAESAGATSTAADAFSGSLATSEAMAEAAKEQYQILVGEGLSPLKQAYYDLKTEIYTNLAAEAKHENSLREVFAANRDLVMILEDATYNTEGQITTVDGLTDSYTVAADVLAQVNAVYDPYSENIEEVTNNSELLEAATMLLNRGFQGTVQELVQAAIEYQQVNVAALEQRDAIIATTVAYDSWTVSLEATVEAQADLNASYREATTQAGLLASGERELTITTQASLTAAQLAAEARQEEAAALAEATAAMAGYFVEATQAETMLVTMSTSQGGLNQAMYDAAVAAGATAEQIAVYGVATGVLTDEQAEAALKSAILQGEVNALAAAYVANDLTITELRVEMAGLIADVNAMDIEINASTGTVEFFGATVAGAGDELVTAADRARSFQEAAEAAAGDYDINFNINQNGQVPSTPGYQGSSGAGNVAPPDGYALGGYTGDGNASEIAGVVHRNEYVLPPHIVDAWGVEGIENLFTGQGGGVAAQATTSTRGGDTFVFNISAPGGDASGIEQAVERVMEKYGRRADIRIRGR